MKGRWWRTSPLLFWLASLVLLPLLAWQGRQARRDTPRLPEASGANKGQWGDGEPGQRLLVIGESTAAGVGVDVHDQGLASQLARALYDSNGQTCGWHTMGRNGVRLTDLIDGLPVDSLPQADCVLLSMGVNDTTGFTGLAHYRRQLLALRQRLQAHYPSPLVLLSVPPMHRFTALPQPLRLMMGWRARQIDQVKRDLSLRLPDAFRYIGYPPMSDASLLASDGYHPGPGGYRAMAAAIAASLAADGR